MRKSTDPFEDDPLPKAFYYPTHQKELSKREKKICFSPGCSKEDPALSPADKKFLQLNNHIKIHEVPTRENGTIEDQTSSSKFDESWPSTERALVSTPEMETDTTATSKTTSSEGHRFPLHQLPDATLARYIYRFRHEPPTSRQMRDKTSFLDGKEGEFWWLSPSPPSSSTPKEDTPPDRLLPSPRRSFSPKLKRTSGRRRSSPSRSPSASPILNTRGLLSPYKSSIEGLDNKTAELQRRAKTLIEKSETTLESSSSEPQLQVKKVRRRPQEESRAREVPSQHPSSGPHRHEIRPYQPRPAPPPEEDILYQWRLARKMERAQEQASKWPSSGSTVLLRPRLQDLHLGETGHELLRARLPMESHKASTTEPISTSLSVASEIPARDALPTSISSVLTGISESSTMAYLTTGTKTTPAAPQVLTCDREAIPQQTTIPRASTAELAGTPSRIQQLQTLKISEQSVHSVAGDSENVPSANLLHVSADSREQFSSADVPSHMHLSCDILPCPHQKALLDKAKSDQSVEVPLSLPVVELMQSDKQRERTDEDATSAAQRPAVLPQGRKFVREKSEKRIKLSLNGSQKSSASTSKQEIKKQQRKEGQAKKLDLQQATSENEPTTDLLSGVIGEVISERLFSTPQTFSNSSSSLESSRETVVRPNTAPFDFDTSDEEFPEDEVLKMLQERARKYREKLRQIESILNQQATARG